MTPTEFEQTVSRLRPTMLRVAIDFFGRQDDAEDAVQDALLLLWRYCEHIDATQNVCGLAVRVTKNCCVSLLRRQKPMPERHEDTSSSPLDLLVADETRSAIREVVGQLPPRERELFELRHWEGLSVEEIAAKTGIGKASVKSMVSAARRKVMDELKRRLEP